MARTTFSADHDATDATGRDVRGWLGRFGLVGRGMLYLALGTLALQFAFGNGSSGQVSDTGAIAFVKQQPFGTIMLWVLAGSLAALALWQFATAVTGDPVKGSDASDRAVYALKGLVYGATAAAAFTATATIGSGSGGGSGGGRTQATAYVLDLPGGRWIVMVVGAGVAAYGVWTLWQHARGAEFMQRLSTGSMDANTRDSVEFAGRMGYGARGTVIGITGIFLVIAGLQHSPDSTRGLSGALVTLSQQPYGQWLLGAAAAGLFLYGVFSLVEARYRRAA